MGLLIEIAIVVAALAMVWRGIRRQFGPSRPRRAKARSRDLVETLEKDPATGVYRPREPRE